ncbi:InlB B-repeat-containing protein [Chiayiivirga flava]|uniref:Bacterial repeat domain-containing protein n=1 Tax=Chiayiivirga flava TaxID=659595 RepID=A0A7W8D5P8_9GAMM|nr:hypothetical protein [Chiayiivirga flava]MBB5208375.1 hypothetical protein [Chiayiivirga flava]
MAASAGLNAAVLTAATTAGNNHRGNMFDLTVNQNVAITQFDISPMGNMPYEIHYKEGTWNGFANDPPAWTLMQSGEVTFTGSFVPVPLDEPIILTPGQTHGFYITSATTSVSVNYSDGTGVGNVFSSDAVMTFYEGGGMEYPFTAGTGGVFQPRVWNGAIHYEVIGAATQFAITAPASVNQGAAFDFEIVALDANGFRDPGYSGTVHFTSTDPTADLPADVALVAGQGTFSATLNGTGDQQITATDAVAPAITGTSATIDVSPVYVVTGIASPLEGGSVVCDPAAVLEGDTSTCTVSTNVGYTLTDISGCGGTPGITSPYTTGPVTEDCDVTATFTLNTYPIDTTVSPAGAGVVSCTPNPVPHGSDSTCTATANPGFVFETWSGDCAGATCTLADVQAAGSVTAQFLATQTIVLTVPTPQAFVPDTVLDVTATASSGLPVSLASSTPSVCSVDDNIVLIVSAGTCTLTADQAGNGQYAAAPQVTRSASIVPMVDVSVDIDDGVLGLPTGRSTVYSVVVANAGPSAVTDLRMTSDVIGLGNLDWQCLQAESSATCPVPDVGTGTFDLLLAMEAGHAMHFEVVGTMLGQAGTFAIHSVELTPPAGTMAIQTGDDQATDTNVVIPMPIFSNGFEAPSESTLEH